MVVTPDGAPWASRPRVDNAMVKALARAFRWQRMLDDGVCGTIEELAERERVNARLHEPGAAADAARAGHRRGDPRRAAAGGMRLEDLLEGFPVEWMEQRSGLVRSRTSPARPDVTRVIEQPTGRLH